MAAGMPEGRRVVPRTGLGDRTPTVERLTLRQITVLAGMLLMPLAVIVLASAALLRVGGWTGAALVLAGTLLLATGIGLVSAPAHARHLASRNRQTASRVPHTERGERDV